MPSLAIRELFGVRIDKFLSELSDEAKRKMWPVVNALRLELELSGSTTFPVPLDKLRRNRCSDEDARATLANLHRRGILSVSVQHKVRYNPDEFSVQTIDEHPEIYAYPKATVSLNREQFSYLNTKLKLLVHPEKLAEAKEQVRHLFAQESTSKPAFDNYIERTKQIQKEQEESFEKRVEEQRERRDQRERLRIEQVKADGGNQLVYTIKQIIQGAILHKESVGISVYALGFEETINGMSNASALLSLLKKEGCIKDFKRLGNDHFKIEGAQVQKLKDRLEEMTSPSTKVKENIHKDKDTIIAVKEIQLIEIRKNDLYYYMVINGEVSYRALVKASNERQYWGHIHKISLDGKAELNDSKIGTGILQFFNSSPRNPLYKRGLKYTKVLTYRSDYLYPSDNIKIKPMKDSTFKKFFK